MSDRHPGTRHLLDLLVPNPNLPEHLRVISERVYHHATDIVDSVQDGPELTAGLRKLLEAKDCFVRQALIDARPTPEPTPADGDLKP